MMGLLFVIGLVIVLAILTTAEVYTIAFVAVLFALLGLTWQRQRR